MHSRIWQIECNLLCVCLQIKQVCLQIKQESLQVFLLFETFKFFLRFLSEERKTHYACNFSKIKENFSFMSLEESFKNLGRKVMAKHRIHTIWIKSEGRGLWPKCTTTVQYETFLPWFVLLPLRWLILSVSQTAELESNILKSQLKKNKIIIVLFFPLVERLQCFSAQYFIFRCLRKFSYEVINLELDPLF